MAHAYELPSPGRWPGRTISAGTKTPPEMTSRIAAKASTNVALVEIYPQAPRLKFIATLIALTTSDITIIGESSHKHLICETISGQLDNPD
jgi:hypothetical protein